MKTVFVENQPKYTVGDLIYTDILIVIDKVVSEPLTDKEKKFIITRNNAIRNCCGNNRAKRENSNKIIYNGNISERQIKCSGIDEINTFLKKEFADLNRELDNANGSIRKIREYIE